MVMVQWRRDTSITEDCPLRGLFRRGKGLGRLKGPASRRAFPLMVQASTTFIFGLEMIFL